MKERRVLKAVEVEKMFDEARVLEHNFIQAESAIVSSLYESAKRNGRLGDKLQMVVNPVMIHIPDWQRDADLTRARAIGTGYNSALWDVPKVIISNGKIICIDGMHRLLGALLAGKDAVVVEILEITELEAIEIFLGQTRGKKRMAPKDYYRASMKAGREDYIKFTEICHKYNVQVVGDDTLPNPIGIFTSLNDGIKADKRVLENILALLEELGWAGKENGSIGNSQVYSSKTIRSLKKLYAYFEGRETEMEKILIDNCLGSLWFENNLLGYTQTKVFDILFALVKENMKVSAAIDSDKVVSISDSVA